MIEKAERRGELKKGMTILECSTGNAGIAAVYRRGEGYRCIIVMPEGMSEERKKMDVAYGAEMVYTPGGESDVDLALEMLAEIRRQDPAEFGFLRSLTIRITSRPTTRPPVQKSGNRPADAWMFMLRPREPAVNSPASADICESRNAR